MNVISLEEYRERRTGDPAVIIEDAKKFYEGTIYPVINSGFGGYIKIIEYINNQKVIVEFLDDTHYRRSATLRCIKDGSVKNPYTPIGVGGYLGEGPYSGADGFVRYRWKGILKRAHLHDCISPNAYEKCSLCPEWYNFENFAAWFYDYLSKLNPKYKNEYSVDKDILQWNQVNKIYSPSTCCLVPLKLNVALAGQNYSSGLPKGVVKENKKYRISIHLDGTTQHCPVCDTPEEAFEIYKTLKTKRIRELADFYYNEGAILPDIHEKLYNLEIRPYPLTQ